MGEGERASLVRSGLRPVWYGRDEPDPDGANANGEAEAGRVAEEGRKDSEMDLYFGAWPWRVLNYRVRRLFSSSFVGLFYDPFLCCAMWGLIYWCG
jgi:hypothetical protein